MGLRLLALEIGFVIGALFGVGMMSMAAAMVIGGVLGVLACERASARASRGEQESQ